MGQLYNGGFSFFKGCCGTEYTSQLKDMMTIDLFWRANGCEVLDGGF
jgi:hypothetical protein